MYNWDNYDNDIAYSYDDYVEEQEEELGQDDYDFERYQEQMIGHLIDIIREDI